jgi:hypothetical protein
VGYKFTEVLGFFQRPGRDWQIHGWPPQRRYFSERRSGLAHDQIGRVGGQ